VPNGDASPPASGDLRVVKIRLRRRNSRRRCQRSRPRRQTSRHRRRRRWRALVSRHVVVAGERRGRRSSVVTVNGANRPIRPHPAAVNMPSATALPRVRDDEVWFGLSHRCPDAGPTGGSQSGHSGPGCCATNQAGRVLAGWHWTSASKTARQSALRLPQRAIAEPGMDRRVRWCRGCLPPQQRQSRPGRQVALPAF
jgi:hypothetical protein